MKSLAVSVACMAIYWPTPGFKGRTFKLCVLNRWDFNFWVRGSPLRGDKPRAAGLASCLATRIVWPSNCHCKCSSDWLYVQWFRCSDWLILRWLCWSDWLDAMQYLSDSELISSYTEIRCLQSPLRFGAVVNDYGAVLALALINLQQQTPVMNELGSESCIL